MQVILTKSVRKLGKVGETVNVADGFGRNYLIPREFAVRATKDNIERFSSIQKDLESKNNDEKKLATEIANKLKDKNLFFVTQSAIDGRLFGSVTAKALALEISKLANHKLNYSNILLDAPIKYNGVYDVKLILHPEVMSNITVSIAKSESEAQDALREHKEGGSKAANDNESAGSAADFGKKSNISEIEDTQE